MVAQIFLIASVCILLSEGISFFDKRQEGEYGRPSNAELGEQEAKWREEQARARAERERARQERCMAENLTVIYYASARPCGEAAMNTVQKAIRVLKAEGPKAALKILAEFPRNHAQTCNKIGDYIECCYRQGNCDLLQNDLRFLIEKGKAILDELEGVQVIDLITMIATANEH